MMKTSLTRGLMAVVAITVPMVGSSVKANAQAVMLQTTTADTNQLDKHNPGKIDRNEARGNPSVVNPGIIGKQSHQDTVVIVPKATITPFTAQVPQPKATPPSETESNQENQNLPTTPQTSPPNPETTEARVLVSEVVVKTQTKTITPELEAEIYKVIRTQAGQTATRSQLQEDINAIARIGLFSNVQALPEDTPLGVRLSFIVTPNPILSQVELEANPGTGVASVLPAETVQEIFSSQYGKILNLRELQEGIKQLTKRYQDQGYVLANLIGVPKISEKGVVTLQIAEGVVENVKVKFRDKEGQEVNEKGEPIRGRTKDYIITREVELKPGQVFNRNIVQRDLQ
ncbi:MAG: POTRA domain-containing protein, partial [Dolichospermum sp.]